MGLTASQKQYFDHHLQELLNWIKIPSVFEESKDYPYGKPVYDALKYIENLAQTFHFETKYYDYGVVDIVWGKGKKFYIPCHVDVVSVGIGWDHDPFLGEIVDHCVYGRGSEDMKGGGWLILSVMNYLKENGYLPTYEYHLIFGSDEERTMAAMKQYGLEHEDPVFGFTPDGHFPLVAEEKGAAMVVIEGKIDSDIELTAGVQPNVVSPIVTYIENGITNSIKGKNAHASTPEKGIDATLLFLKERSEPVFQKLYNLFSKPLYSDQTWIIGLLEVKNGSYKATIDIRYPYGTKIEDYIHEILKVLPNTTITIPYNDGPTSVADDSKECQSLIQAYESITKDSYTRQVSGGVTYSKVIRNVVSFGYGFDKEKSTAHQKNERVSLIDLEKAFEIYLLAFQNLGGK